MFNAKKEKTPDVWFNIVLVGDVEVGKTNLVNSFTKEKFQEKYEATVGAGVKSMSFPHEQEVIGLRFWDRGAKYQLAITYPMRPDAIFIVFDVTKQESFKSVDKYYQEAKDYIAKQNKSRRSDAPEYKPLIMLLGNKFDINHLHDVTLREANQKANDLEIEYKITSNVSRNIGIQKTLDTVVEVLYSPNQPKKNLEIYITPPVEQIRNLIEAHFNTNNNPYEMGFFGSAEYEFDGRKIKLPKSIIDIYNICLQYDEDGDMTEKDACDKIREIVEDKELRLKNSFWDGVIKLIRAILRAFGLGPSKKVREEMDRTFQNMHTKLTVACG